MRSEAGFTLIEALVAGLVSLVIPAVLIAVMAINNRQIGQSATTMRMSQIATGLSDEIHRAGLAATWVYSSAEQAGIKCPASDPDPNASQAGVLFCDGNKDILKGFRVGGNAEGRDTLEEYVAATGTWRPIVYAGNAVTVSHNLDRYYQKVGTGFFGISPKGAFLWFNLRLDMTIAGTRDSLPLQTQSVVCRNAPERMESW